MASSSNLNLNQIKQIPQNYKDIVNGYIKISQNDLFDKYHDNNFYIIPPLVINLCILFCYDVVDEFNPELCGKWLDIFSFAKCVQILDESEYEMCTKTKT